MEYRCLIVDDEPPAQRIVERYLDDVPNTELVAKCNDVFAASEILRKQSVDIMFLDINMPKMTGLEFIKSMNNPPAIIITTAYREYALEGFELNVIDYLKKPFSFERFFRAINKAFEQIENKNKQSSHSTEMSEKKSILAFIFVKEDKVIHRVNFNDILFIESVGDYNKIVTPHKVYLTYQTLRKLQEFLPHELFMRIHKSFIVSLSKIDTVVGNQVKIREFMLPVGQTFRQSFYAMIEKHK